MLLRWLILMLLSLGASTHARAEVVYQGRHVVLLDAGLDSVYGSYWFSVENPTTKPERLRMQVVLPKEVDDWRVQDGVKENEMHLDNGALIIDKEFSPGTTVIAIGFRAPATLGEAKLTYVWPYQIADFQVLAASHHGPVMTSDQLMAGTDVDFSGRSYRRLSAVGITVGETYIVKLSGLLEGRGRLWVIGSTVAGLLVLAGIGLGWMTRPKKNEME